MARFWLLMGLMVAAMLLLFFVAQALHLPFLEEDKDYWLRLDGWVAALAGVGLLISDVLAPVPSSIIMFVNGILFGVAGGTALSLLGGLGAAFAGHWLGARGGRNARRWMGEPALLRAQAFFQTHGMWAIVLSRPIPILAEATAIAAGMAGMHRGRLLTASAIGLLPAALLYAIAGAYAVDMQTGLWSFLAVMALATLTYLISRFVLKHKTLKHQ